MQDSHDDYPGAYNLEDGSVIAIYQMTVRSAKQFVFRHQRAALRKVFECVDLFFQPKNKGSRRLWFILGDIVPYFGDVSLSGCGNLNAEFF